MPRKNLRLAGGIPLVGHAVTAARASRLIDRVVVSTDDQEIADVARSFGAEVPFLRPPALARDDAPELAAWRHALDTLEADGQVRIDVLASIPPTAPLRVPEDIDACIMELTSSEADAVVTVTKAHRSPHFNMVALDNGRARVLAPLAVSPGRRQDVPAAYDVTTVAYAARPAYVRRATGILDGHVRAVIVPHERALDIDTEHDLRVADLLLTAAR